MWQFFTEKFVADADLSKSDFQNGTLMVPSGTDMLPERICVNLVTLDCSNQAIADMTNVM